MQKLAERSSSAMNRKDMDYCLQSLSLEEKRKLSAHQVALSNLEFKKQFLIVSYCGKMKVEDVITVEAIRSLENLPMVLFETELWRLFGCKCIQDTDRAKNLDWNSDSTFMYHCEVYPDGNYQFKGPYLQPGKTHLQRVLGDENVLLVKFAKSSGVDGNETVVKCSSATSIFSRISKESLRGSGSNSTYHRIRREGISVGLRRYNFFVFKDSSKKEKNKGNSESTFSSVKCYFVCMKSGVSPLVERPCLLLNKSISEARSVFMHIHNVSIAKYMARLSLILSKTYKFDIDVASINIVPIKDQPCLDQNGNATYNEDGEARIHTDGTGFISRDLALKCPRIITKGKYSSQGDYESMLLHHITGESSSKLEPLITSYIGDPPLLIQFRLFYKGSAVKGTLLVNNALPPNTIHIRPSMVKVKSDDDPILQKTESVDSFEVVSTSKRPRKSYLSKYLIALLNYGGVPKEYFLGLLTNALEKAKRVSYNTRAALKVCLSYGEMDDFLLARMILSGIPIGEPHLQNRLSVLMRENFKSLKEGKIPIDESYYLMGTADPTGMLNTDQVCVILESGQISGDVLVYRHPGLHFGDVHVMKAVYVKELENIIGRSKYGIFFPAKGPRSIADEIANGDFDGDTYWVSRNGMLLNWFKPSKPWVKAYHTSEKVQHSMPTQFSSDKLEDELFEQLLTASFCSNSKGLAANSWLGLMDRLLIMGDGNTEEKERLKGKMLHLAEIYYDALDAGKTGNVVNVPDNLRTEKSPHFLSKSESDCNVYHSSSVLGLIYDTVGSYEESSKQEIVVRKLPSFDGEIPRASLLLWDERYNKYRGEMRRAMGESEAVKGKLADAIIQKYKQMLYNAAELNVSTRNKEDIFKEALAIYHICYDYANEHGVGLCSFAWRVAGLALCDIFVSKQKGSHFICSKSVLQEVLNS